MFVKISVLQNQVEIEKKFKAKYIKLYKCIYTIHLFVFLFLVLEGKKKNIPQAFKNLT